MKACLETVGCPGARDDLLAHTCHHLCDVDGGALTAALTHDEGAVVPVKRTHAHLGTAELTRSLHDSLECVSNDNVP